MRRSIEEIGVGGGDLMKWSSDFVGFYAPMPMLYVTRLGGGRDRHKAELGRVGCEADASCTVASDYSGSCS